VEIPELLVILVTPIRFWSAPNASVEVEPKPTTDDRSAPVADVVVNPV